MNFQQYYPTPSELAEKLVKRISRNFDGLVLEPSAGQGHLMDAIKKRWSWKNNIHCVELNPERAAILKSKSYPVIWDDFLTFNPLTPYNLIMMNPPFHEGTKHLLKALKILAPDGEIACILNAETIRNPYTNERKDLIRLLEEMQTYNVDFVQNAFVDLENPTGVEIAIVYSKKQAASERCITFDGFKKSIVDNTENDFQGIVRHGEINGLIDNYRAEVQTALHLYDEVQNYNKISLHTYDAPFEIKINHGDGKAGIIRAINRNYWTKLLYSKELNRLLTHDAQCQYSSKIHEMAEFEFNERNITQLKMDLTRNLFGSIEKAIMRTWETFTSRFSWADYSKNIHYYNGWKTNKAYKVNHKVILPLNAFQYGHGEFRPNYTVCGELSDIEKALNYLDCGRTEAADMAKELQFAQTFGVSRGIDTKYFTITLYKKGTAHLTFKDLNLLKKFNLYCGRKFNWLPEGYGIKPYRDLTDEEKVVADSFEGRDSYEETFQNQDFYLTQNTAPNLLMLTEG